MRARNLVTRNALEEKLIRNLQRQSTQQLKAIERKELRRKKPEPKNSPTRHARRSPQENQPSAEGAMGKAEDGQAEANDLSGG